MKKKVFLQLMIGIFLVWGIIALPVAAFASDTDKSAEKHFEKANKLLKQEQYEAAIAEYDRVVKLVTRSEIAQDAQYWIGQSYFRMGEFDKALAIFETLIKEYPESAIVPATQIMMKRVQQEKENQKLRVKNDAASDRKVIIDQKTGLKYTKFQTLTGKKDVIKYTLGLNLSPNGKFLLWGKLVIPPDDGEPFNLVDMPVERGFWSPDGKKVVFCSAGAIWVIPISPETGRATGPAKKLLDGEYRYQIVSWAPDSERIVFERSDKEIRGDIYTLSVNDGTMTRVTNSPAWEGEPIWSPDGKTIAYRLGYFVQVIPVEGGSARRIATKGCNYPVSWVPNGEWLIYTVDGRYRFFRLADEYEFEIVPLRKEVGSFFSWSPVGQPVLLSKSSMNGTKSIRMVTHFHGRTMGQSLP